MYCTVSTKRCLCSLSKLSTAQLRAHHNLGLDHLISLYSGFKKTHLKEMTDFLTLKMLPVALALIKPKKRHLLAPLVQNHPFYIGNCSNSKFSFKIGDF